METSPLHPLRESVGGIRCTVGIPPRGARSGVGAARVRFHGRSVAHAQRARASGVKSPDGAIARGAQRTAPRRRLGREPKIQFEEPWTEALHCFCNPPFPRRGARGRARRSAGTV